jgi:TRAP-type mannitol/chloroaromatic compound transport system permease small subunit
MANQKQSENSRENSPTCWKSLSLVTRINEWQGKILSYLVVVATVQVCIELTLRYAFNSPTTWGLELTIYLCAITYVMGGAYAQVSDSHLKLDLLYQHWSARKRAIVDLLVTDVLFFFFCGILVWQSGIWAWQSIARGLTSGTIWDPPIWPMRSFLFLGSLLLLLQGFVKFVRDLTIAFPKKEEK